MDYGMIRNPVPLLSPQDITNTATATPFVNLKTAKALALQVQFGTVTSASADQSIAVTVEASSVGASGAEAAIPFRYRLSGAVGSNALGALTDATTSGATIASTDDDKTLWIYIDPAAVLASLTDAQYVRVVITPDAGYSACLVAANAYISPRYQQASPVSAT